MDYTEQILDNRRALINDFLRRVEQLLEPFADDLQEFLSTLLKARLPDDWRDQWHAFVDDSAAKGFIVQAQSVVELEAWIEAWAKRRRLLPATVDQPAVSPNANQRSAPSGQLIGPILPDSKTVKRYLHTGQDFNATSGLQCRYDSQTEHRMTQDPIEFQGDPSNRYRYVGNSPTKAAAPTGFREPVKLWGFVPGAIVIDGGLEKPKVDKEIAEGLYPRIGASLDFSWRAIPPKFQGNGPSVLCEVCHKVGVVQIYRNTVKYKSNVPVTCC